MGMTEGLLGGILGEEDENSEVEATETLASAEAFAAAVVARLSASDPEVARDTSAFLQEQTQLLKVQKDHLKDEHALRLKRLSGQAREGKLRRVGIRIRIAFQVFLALVATVIGIIAAVAIRDAVTSKRVVIEPFDAPPALATRGVSGKVIAGGLLDQLSRLQDATRSSTAGRDLTGAWSSNIKLDVPETGVSLGEISRLLKEQFGHDVHIEGDLIETPTGGLTLTVRGNGVPPKSFGAPAAELDKLTAAAAEYVYSKSQPARWAAFLTNSGRNEEAIAFCRTAIPSVDAPIRAELLNDWANALENTGGSAREALALYREAARLDPGLWRSYSNIMNTFMLLGEEEEAWHAGQDMRKAAGGRPGRAPEQSYANWDLLTWNLGPWLTAAVADAAANAGVGTALATAGTEIADIEARRHDPAAANLALQTMKDDPRDPAIAAMAHFVRGRLASEADDSERAVAEMEAFGAVYADPIVSSNFPGYYCWIAQAEAAAGHPDKADAVLNSAGTFVDCYRFHGDLLDGRGDWKGAQEWYAKAVALAPELPAGYYSWGLALAKHGDLARAEAKLKDANQRGPHWADPLKAWGDVLVKQGKTSEALAKYNEALKYAPNWKQLKEAREAMAKQKG
jgi:tetratricopeptide (TPR) repeat protein